MIVTAIYSVLIALLFVLLAARVIRYRRANLISLGDGDDKILLRRVRAHANCAEYAPIGLLLLACAESLSGHPFLLHVVGSMLLVGRVLHAYGVSGPKMNLRLRTAGMVLTFLAIVGGVIATIGQLIATAV